MNNPQMKPQREPFDCAKNQLKPHQIDWLFGRGDESTARAPTLRGTVVGAAMVAIVFVVAAARGKLYGGAAPSATREMFSRQVRSDVVRLPLLEDPTSLYFLTSAVLSPFFCAEQVFAIRRYVEKLCENGLLALASSNEQIVLFEKSIRKSNLRYQWLGGKLATALCLVAALSTTFIIALSIHNDGIYRSWYFSPPGTSPSASQWAQAVSSGWWANMSSQTINAVLYGLTLTFMFYSIYKQVLMGFVFMAFTRDTHKAGMGICPNFAANTDGFHGLRFVRRFMQVNFTSVSFHGLLYSLAFFVFLRVNMLSIAGLASVLGVSVAVIFYPTGRARKAVVDSKIRMSALVASNSLERLKRAADQGLEPDVAVSILEASEDHAEMLKRFWEEPHLPFRFRNTFTAVGVYLLVPASLALLASILGR